MTTTFSPGTSVTSAILNITNGTAAPFRLPFDDVTVTWCAVFLLSFLVIGFCGSLLTIIVILSCTKLQSVVFNQIILSLCFADLTSACVSWVNLYRRTWGFNQFLPPDFFCWFYWGADILTSYVTAMHFVVFSVLRFVSVWRPAYMENIKIVHVKIGIFVMWFIGFISGFVPVALLSGVSVIDRSDLSIPNARWPSCTQYLETISSYGDMIAITFPLFLYAPCMAIMMLFVATLVVTKRKRRERLPSISAAPVASLHQREEREEERALLQVSLIVVSFVVGYFPFTNKICLETSSLQNQFLTAYLFVVVFEFYAMNNTDSSYEGWKAEWLFGTVQYIFMRFSECLNPIFYNCASAEMREKSLEVLRCQVCRWHRQPTVEVPVSATNSVISQSEAQL